MDFGSRFGSRKLFFGLNRYCFGLISRHQRLRIAAIGNAGPVSRRVPTLIGRLWVLQPVVVDCLGFGRPVWHSLLSQSCLRQIVLRRATVITPASNPSQGQCAHPIIHDCLQCKASKAHTGHMQGPQREFRTVDTSLEPRSLCLVHLAERDARTALFCLEAMSALCLAAGSEKRNNSMPGREFRDVSRTHVEPTKRVTRSGLGSWGGIR